MFAKHVTRDISAYCHGELSPEASRQFAEHIISCAKCREEFEEIKLGIKLAEQLPLVPAPESLWVGIEAQLGTQRRMGLRRRPWQTRVAAIAAAVLLVFGSVAVWWLWGQGSKKHLANASWQVQSLN